MKQKHFIHLRLLGFVLTIAFIAGCERNIHVTSIPSVTITQPVSPIASSTPTVEPSLTINPTPTLVDTKPVWEIKENWPLANQIRAMLIDKKGDLWTGGPAGVVHWDLKTNVPTVYAIRNDPEHTNALGLSQTPDGSIWVGTYGNGLARFDGTNWKTFTKNSGLPGDFVTNQTITAQGNLWLVILKERQSRDGAQFGRLNGTTWVKEFGGAFDHILALPNGSIISTYNYDYASGTGIFTSTIRLYDGIQWIDLGATPDGWIDAVTVAPNGAIWFTTHDAIYQGVNQSWTKMKPPWEKQPDFPTVSSIAVSSTGVIWFGFSFHTNMELDQCGWRLDTHDEYGVYRYDGKTWVHYTTENGLIDDKICAITIDANDNIWFGSYDKGVSRFDGETWTSYVVP